MSKRDKNDPIYLGTSIAATTSISKNVAAAKAGVVDRYSQNKKILQLGWVIAPIPWS